MNNHSGGNQPPFSPESHSFNVYIATLCGLEAAVVFNHIFFWIKHNRLQGVNLHEGRTWMFQTMENMAEYFPYLTPKQIRNALDRLTDAGILLKANFSSNKMNRTSWYALADESWIISPTDTFGPFAQKGKCKCPKGQMHLPAGADDIYKEEDRELRWRKEDTYAAPGGAACVSPISSSSPQQEELPKKSKPLLSQTVLRAIGVLTTEEEHEKLLAKYPPQFVEACYQYLAEWKDSATAAQVAKHKSDYRRITTWVANAVRDKQIKEKELDQREARANSTSSRKNSKLWIPEDDKSDTFDWRSKIPAELREDYDRSMGK